MASGAIVLEAYSAFLPVNRFWTNSGPTCFGGRYACIRAWNDALRQLMVEDDGSKAYSIAHTRDYLEYACDTFVKPTPLECLVLSFRESIQTKRGALGRITATKNTSAYPVRLETPYWKNRRRLS